MYELKDVILFYWYLENNYPLDRDWRARTVYNPALFILIISIHQHFTLNMRLISILQKYIGLNEGYVEGQCFDAYPIV